MNVPFARGELSNHVFARLQREPRDLGWLPPLAAIDGDDFQVTLFLLQELSFRRIAGVCVPRGKTSRPCSRSGPRSRGSRNAGSATPCTSRAVVRRKWATRSSNCSTSRRAFALRVGRDERHARTPPRVPHAQSRLSTQGSRPALVRDSSTASGAGEDGAARDPTRRVRPPRAERGARRVVPRNARGARPRPRRRERHRSPAGVDVAHEHRAEQFRSITPAARSVPRHLAVFEMTSVEPMARYASACRRLLHGERATQAARFFDVHVAADGLHQRIALERLVGGFATQYPEEASELLFGAAALLMIEGELASHLLTSWADGRTSLRRPLPTSSCRCGFVCRVNCAARSTEVELHSDVRAAEAELLVEAVRVWSIGIGHELHLATAPGPAWSIAHCTNSRPTPVPRRSDATRTASICARSEPTCVRQGRNDNCNVATI